MTTAQAARRPRHIHVYNRHEIMRRAHQIARQRREETARRTFGLGARVVGARIIHARTFAECLAATKLDLSTAMKRAWAEARPGAGAPSHGALIVVRPAGALAPLRRLRFGRIWSRLARAARWIGERFIPARAA